MKNAIFGLAALACSALPLTANAAPAEPVGVQEEAVVLVEVAPPSPRVETFVYRPGFLWARGYYVWSGVRWVWISGHYESIVYGRTWIHAHYLVRGRGYVLVRGHWR